MKSKYYLFFLLLFLHGPAGYSQMITGVWKGKINRQKVELKVIQKGDSLTGTSYYYESPSQYKRYSIKGFFDVETNEAIWWDDQLLEEKTGRSGASLRGIVPLVSRADFNCPGGAKMMLDGKAGKPGVADPEGQVDLDKTTVASFPDEWDFVIDNYTTGANDPDIIDSIALIAQRPVKIEEPVVVRPRAPAVITAIEKKKPVDEQTIAITKPPATQTIEEKLLTRKKVFNTEIPLTGDSIELRFYDNAEIDGDSISLFLNDKLIFQHIRLLGSAYTIRLAVAELHDTNELVMVAENLGSIPPNTSYMVAIVDSKRYEARLTSTEGSSAMIRLVKGKSTP